MPGDLIAAVALPASSVMLGMLLPLAAGLTVIGLVRGFVELRWREFVVGLLLAIGLVAAGVALRTWGTAQASAEQLPSVNQTASVVFTAVTPLGVILGAVLVVVALVRRYVSGALARRREARE